MKLFHQEAGSYRRLFGVVGLEMFVLTMNARIGLESRFLGGIGFMCDRKFEFQLKIVQRTVKHIWDNIIGLSEV